MILPLGCALLHAEIESHAAFLVFRFPEMPAAINGLNVVRGMLRVTVRCANRFFLVPFLLVDGTVQCLNNLYQFVGIAFLRGFFRENPPFCISGHDCTPFLVSD